MTVPRYDTRYMRTRFAGSHGSRSIPTLSWCLYLCFVSSVVCQVRQSLPPVPRRGRRDRVELRASPAVHHRPACAGVGLRPRSFLTAPVRLVPKRRSRLAFQQQPPTADFHVDLQPRTAASPCNSRTGNIEQNLISALHLGPRVFTIIIHHVYLLSAAEIADLVPHKLVPCVNRSIPNIASLSQVWSCRRAVHDRATSL